MNAPTRKPPCDEPFIAHNGQPYRCTLVEGHRVHKAHGNGRNRERHQDLLPRLLVELDRDPSDVAIQLHVSYLRNEVDQVSYLRNEVDQEDQPAMTPAENPLYRRTGLTPFQRGVRTRRIARERAVELASEFPHLVEDEQAGLVRVPDHIDTGHQADPSAFMVPWNGDPETNPLADWLNEVVGTVGAAGVPVRFNAGPFADGTTWSFELGNDPLGIRNTTVRGATGAGKTWSSTAPYVPAEECPNGTCPHPAALHDVQTEDDPRPICCVETDPAGIFCRCGALTRDVVDQFAEYYMTGPGRFNWAEAQRCDHGVRFVVPCAECPPLVGLTPDLVHQYPEYFVSGPGRERASKTECRHGYYLTDSCPGCDHDREVDELIGDRSVVEWLPEVIADLVESRDRRGDDAPITARDLVDYVPPRHQAAAAEALGTGRSVLVTRVGEDNQGLIAAAQAVTPFKHGCPNGTCEHSGLAHDIETTDDPLPLCNGRTADNKRCPCGTLTRAWVEAHPDYYVLGDGYDYASDKRCEHRVQLTEPCTACDAETLAAKKVQS